MNVTTQQVTAAPRTPPAVSASAARANAVAHGGRVGAFLTSTLKKPPAPGQCAWHLGTLAGASALDRAALAWLVADAVMTQRGGRSRAASVWRDAALGGTTVAGRDRQIVEAFVAGVFGLPPQGKSEEHLVGHIAEWLWYLHACETILPSRTLELIEPPKISVTEPGADGFLVFSEPAASELSFRLWEVKQHTGTSAVSSTVNTAYTQLTSNALRYLAQLTGPLSMRGGPVGELCKQLVDLWADSSRQAGVGVGVASAQVPPPQTCFSTMGRYFPEFDQSGQLEGLLLAIQDLVGLAKDVRGYLWIVL